MAAYYNEIDPYAAQWLRNLIAAHHIAEGDVDERDIRDVSADDLKQYDQCHFFAGIGGWSRALRLANWPDDRPVWTGSCPCQPFSAAGKGQAADDERHLWPAWFSFISECHPPIIFGEQVEAAIGWGWLDVVFADLETQGYACGATVLPACSVGAPHIRNRLWFVANTNGRNASAEGLQRGGQYGQQQGHSISESRSNAGGVANPLPAGWPEGRPVAGTGQAPGGGRINKLGDTTSEGLQGGAGSGGDCGGIVWGEPGQGFWSCDWLPCTDGKARPVEPGTFPLAHGVPQRVGRLRAYGNAIVPQVAAEFIMATVN